MNHAPLLCLLLLSACSVGKKIKLSEFDYELGQHAKIKVHSIRRYEKKLEFKLLGISIEEASVAIRKDEIECGAGKRAFIKVKVKNGNKEFFILPKTSYLEFRVTCTDDTDVDPKKTPFILFKKIYGSKNEELGKMLEKNLRITFN